MYNYWKKLFVLIILNFTKIKKYCKQQNKCFILYPNPYLKMKSKIQICSLNKIKNKDPTYVVRNIH